MPSTAQLENAIRFHRAGQLDRAAAIYREILHTEPDQSDALHLLGLISQQAAEHETAASLISQAIAANPRVATYYVNRGLSLRALGRPDEAIADFDRATAIEPRFAEPHHQKGNLLKSLRRHADALVALRRAAELDPRNPTIWLNLGVALFERDARDDAIDCFGRALDLDPDRPEAHNILGAALLSAGRLAEARQALEKAIQLRPAYPAAHDNLGRVFRAQGTPEKALVEFRTALGKQPQPGTHSNLVYALNFVPGLGPAEIFSEHRHWAEIHAAPFSGQQPTHANDRDPERRLRIGYVSPDFVHHAVSYFIGPVLAAHDPARVEIFCYSNALAPDHVTERLRKLNTHWRDIAALQDEQVAALVRADRIDLLVDLAGHTARNRLLVFARRPAPVQITWLGYPNTTGLEEIDYRLTDAISDPPGETDNGYSEKLVRLPGPFSCYRPPDESPPVNASPAGSGAGVTFGCFNHLAKVNATVLDAWSRVLARVPDSRLLLKARSLADAETAAAVRDRFVKNGIDATRLDLLSDELSVPDHLRLYHRVDIALDPFPYNGTTTSCEALWMGVPVVTLAGRTHVARVTASLLTHLGHPEWIAHSENDYIEYAARLASDLPRLETIRRRLREDMRLSPLCDAARFTAQLETNFRQLWRTYCARGSVT